MAVDQIKTLAFLKELSEQVIMEARSGNSMLANRMGGNIALKHFFDNRHAIRPEVWARDYPQYLAEVDRIRGAADEAEQRETERVATNTKIDTLESKLDTLIANLTPYIESQKLVEPKGKPGRPRKDSTPTPPAEPEEDDEKPEGEVPEEK